MKQPGLDHIRAELVATSAMRFVGRITEISRASVSVEGLGDHACLGDLVIFGPTVASRVYGEIVEISGKLLTVLPDGDIAGLAVGDPVILAGQEGISPDDSWIGRIIDPMGRPLDKRALLRGLRPQPFQSKPPDPTSRRTLGRRIDTGHAVFDTLLPIVRGQRIGLFAGSGVGKSTLLGRLARGIDADLVVVGLIGERGREVREFVDKVLGPDGMSKSIVVAATSDRSALMRRRCGWTALAVAEHFRDAGKHVLVILDSLTRFAEAHREVALASGESASLRGFPPSLSHFLPALCERAGPGLDGTGDITAVFSVLVAGSDMDEPVADIVRGLLDGHVVLDREIAERGRFPAVDVLRSVSRCLPDAATAEENALITEARRRLGSYARAELMIQAGLYEHGSDPEIDAAIQVWPKLDAFVGTVAHDGVDASFAMLRRCLELGDPSEAFDVGSTDDA